MADAYNKRLLEVLGISLSPPLLEPEANKLKLTPQFLSSDLLREQQIIIKFIWQKGSLTYKLRTVSSHLMFMDILRSCLNCRFQIWSSTRSCWVTIWKLLQKAK
ncbi:DNA-directed RNA polymerase II subunit rpb4 [Bienertia sinuspersici]